MAERYLFFNSTMEDRRRYQASDIAEYWDSFLKSGLIHADGKPTLKVSADGYNMQVKVDKGKAVLLGHLYINDDELVKEINQTTAIEDRFDRVVLRLDLNQENRFIKIFIKAGTELSPPDLVREGNIYEISLAQIHVKAGKNYLEQTDIIDERLDEDLCGLASSLVTVPTDEFLMTFKAYMDHIEGDWDSWFTGRKIELEEIFPRDTIIKIENTLLELMIQRELENKALEYDVGYWWDSFINLSKIKDSQLAMNTSLKRLSFPADLTEAETVWKEYKIGFISSGITMYYERPKYEQVTALKASFKGEKDIKVVLGTASFL